MKPPRLLKAVMNFAFLGIIFSYVALIFITVDAVFFNGYLPVAIEGVPMKDMDINFNLILILFLRLVITTIFFLSFYFLWRLIYSLIEDELFNARQVRLFRKIGLFTIIGIIGLLLLKILAGYLIDNNLRISTEIGYSFEYGQLPKLVIGLFFLFLSRIFDNARKLKEDNQLTV